MFPLVMPSDAWRVEDPDEEIFLLYSQLQATGSVDEHNLELGGLGYVDSRKGELLVQIDVTPPADSVMEVPSKGGGAHAKRVSKGEQMLWDSLEIRLFQDTTALRSRQGDTGSVLWRASVHLARLLLSQQRFPPANPLLPSTALSTSHILELGAGTGLLSIVLAPHVARYTTTDLPALIPLIRKNQTHNLSPVVLARVVADDLDWMQLHNTPAPARRTLFSLRASPSLAAESLPRPRKGARRKADSSSSLSPPAPDLEVDLVLVVDCIYNPSLIAPLLSTMAHVAGPAPVLVVLELRASDVAREFLEGWLALPGAWEVWSIPLLGSRFAVWAGRRTADQSKE